MSAVAGLLSNSNASATDLVGEYQESILVRNAKGYNVGTSLFGITARLKVENAENSEYNWFERAPTKREVYANGADATPPASSGAAGTIVLQGTTAGATAWPYLAEGHVLRNDRTGEYVILTATPTTDTVNVLRAIHTTTMTGLTIADEDTFQIVTLGKDEGALPTRASYEEPETLTNYVQTFNSVVEITNAFKGQKLRTDIEGPLRERRVQALERIGKDIELAYLLGVKKKLTGTNGYEYLTGGLKHAVDVGAPNNVLNGLAATGVTLAVVQNWLQTFLTAGSDMKLAFCGPKAFAAFSNFATQATAGFRINNQETVFGMNITNILTPFGELSLAMHPLLKEITSLNGWMFIVDLAHLVQKSMEPLFLEPNIQANGQDSYKEQYRAKLGLKLKFADAFAYAQNLQLIKVS